jgi:hypothetical protein
VANQKLKSPQPSREAKSDIKCGLYKQKVRAAWSLLPPCRGYTPSKQNYKPALQSVAGHLPADFSTVPPEWMCCRSLTSSQCSTLHRLKLSRRVTGKLVDGYHLKEVVACRGRALRTETMLLDLYFCGKGFKKGR